MLEAVRLSRPLPDQVSLRYTFSAGIACAERNEKADDLYRRADLALYAAKMRGRNQISLDTAARVG
jgi:PleD family two-component response regulator